MEKYKITRCIRFKLEPDKEHLQLIKRKIDDLKNTKEDKKRNLLILIQRGMELPNLLSEYIRYNGSNKLKSNVKVHYRWLRLFTKEQYYIWKKDNIEKKIKINDIDYLVETFESFFQEWNNVIQRLNLDSSKPEELKTRDSEIALSIKKLCSRNMLPFIKAFVENSNPKDTEDIKNRLLSLLVEVDRALEKAEYDYLPSQSSGLIIARASFNYYTINKKQRDYQQEINDANQKLKSGFLRANDNLFKELKINEFCLLPLIDLYPKIKEYKSAQKSQFLEEVSKKLEFNEIKSRYPLFQIDEEDKYQKFIEISEKIRDLSTKKSVIPKEHPESYKLKNEIIKLKQLRSEYFRPDTKKSNNLNKRNNFIKYNQLCGIYKKIAQERGWLIAQIKGIEKERVDSQLLTYWALILEKDLKHFLILIPKEEAQEIYNKIRKSEEKNNCSDSIVYYFESMTYNALRKLCFGVNGNTFFPEIRKELPQYDKLEFGNSFGEFCFYTDGDSKDLDEKKLVTFYQDVLKTDYVKKTLVLPQSIFDSVRQCQ